MNSKERVLTAIAHAEPDRVPMDFAGRDEITARLLKHFGTTERESLLQALHVDFRWADAPYVGPRLHPEIAGLSVNPEWGTRWRWVPNETSGYYEAVASPLQNATMDDVENFVFPDPDDYDYDIAVEQARQHSDYAVCIGSGANASIICEVANYTSMEQVFCDIADEDEVFLRFTDRLLAARLAIFERTLEATKGWADIAFIGEDLGSQRGPLVGPAAFEKIFKPRHQIFIDAAKAHDLPVMMHACGSMSWAYGDYADMGVNVFDAVQPEAKDMEPQWLKETFGDRLAFHGMMSTTGPLLTGTPNETEAMVRRTLEIMKPGGGYCLSPTHLIQDDTPTENVIRMYEAGLKYGVYS
jgi:uroporphyrinogen decarboxylase